MNRTSFSNRPALFLYGIALIASFLLLPLFASAQTPAASGASYDDYLLATQRVGETLGEGIKGGVESTKELYQNAWNKLVSLGGAKVAPSLASYAEYSNNLGKAFTQTLIAGTRASQEFSQKIWNTDPYGRYVAMTADVSDAFDGAINYLGSFFKTKPTTNNQQPTTTKPQAVKPQTPARATVTTPVAQPKLAAPTPKPAATPIATTPPPKPPLKTAPQGEALAVPAITTRVLAGVTSADLELKIQQLRNELVSKIGQVAGQTQSNYQNNFAAIALTNKIDQLTNTTITTPTITGGSITGASISGTSASLSGAFTGTTGTFSGLVTVATLGIATSSPSDTFALNGAAYFAQVSAPSVTTNRLYNESGNLTWNGSVIGGASTGQWTLSGSDVYRSSGNVGIGTTSPYAKLSVVGETVSSYFTATSTTATSTFANHISIASGADYRINGAPVLSGSSSGGVVGFGNSNTSTGVAVGIGNTTSSNVTNAFGSNNTASGFTSTAFGYANSATSTFSVAFGYQNNSGGVNSVSFGYTNSAYSNNSIALGNTNTVSAIGAIAVGRNITNTTASSLMIGPSDTAKLTILSSGNVGIGTTSPYAKLSVVGETVSSYFTATSTTATSTFNGGFAAGTGSSPSGLVYDRSTGYVGIGTSAAERPLEIYNGTGMKIKYPGFNSFYIGLNSDGVNLTAAPNGSGGDNHFNFYTTSSQGCDYQCAATRRMTIRGDTGNVGIGTTSPYAKLSVVGETVSSYFTATSTTATSTFANHVSIASGKDYRIDGAPVLSGSSNGGVVGFGNSNTSSGVAVGISNITSNTLAGAFGRNNTASGFGSTAFGYANSATSTSSVAFGYQNNSGGISSVALGLGNSAYANGSIAIGNSITNTTASSLMIGPSDAAKLTILSTGNVGIGTTSPWRTLSVVGQAVITATTTIGIGSTGQQAGILVGFGGICVDNDGTCTASTTGRVSAVSYTTGSTDLAENYTSSQTLKAGDIVQTEGGDTVGKADGTNTVIGIVSTKPGIILGLGNDTETPNQYPIALAGRVPVNVNLEGGEIKKGDRITLSSTPGEGQKATTSAYTVGIALEDFNASTPGSILVFVNLTWSRLDPSISQGTILDGTGESSFWSVEEGSGRIKFISQGIDLNDQDIVNVRAIVGSAGKWSIDANGKLVIGEVEADKVTTKTLCVDDVCIEKDTLRALLEKNGVTQSAAVINGSQPTTDNAQQTITESISSLESSEASPSSESSEGGAGSAEPAPESNSAPSAVEEPTQEQQPEPAPTSEPTPDSILTPVDQITSE